MNNYTEELLKQIDELRARNLELVKRNKLLVSKINELSEQKEETLSNREAQLDSIRNQDFEELELTAGLYNALQRSGIRTVGELCSYTKEELLLGPAFTQKWADEAEKLCSNFGLHMEK